MDMPSLAGSGQGGAPCERPLPSPAPDVLELRHVGGALHVQLAPADVWETGPYARHVRLPGVKAEAARCAALRAAGFDLTAPQPGLEPVVAALAAELSLYVVLLGLDAERDQHLVASHGFQAQGALPRACMLANWGLLLPGGTPAVVAVPDLTADQRCVSVGRLSSTWCSLLLGLSSLCWQHSLGRFCLAVSMSVNARWHMSFNALAHAQH